MWRTITCMCACAALTARAADFEPRCTDAERCALVRSSDYDLSGFYHLREFLLEGKKVTIEYEFGYFDQYLKVDCNGSQSLDSKALPSFISAPFIRQFTLRSCPPPAAGGSFLIALSALNVTLLRSDGEGSLTLEQLAAHPPLQAQHFAGLEDLFELKLSTASNVPTTAVIQPTLLPDFLSALRTLRTLEVRGVTLPCDELNYLASPDYLSSLTLDSIAVLTLPDLKLLPKLRTLNLYEWTGPLEALTHCDELQELTLSSPAAKALPDRWFTRCPRFKILTITNAKHLVSLTSKLLENTTKLQDLSLTDGVLETLEAGLLDDVPKLRTLKLRNNRLQVLPSELFLRQGALKWLDLSHNQLSTEAVAALPGLHSLIDLNLSNNPRLTDLCDTSSDYSPLLNLKELAYLYFTKTSITHTCRDWRQNLTSLIGLDLSDTNITELQFSELQYTRDKSISEVAMVYLWTGPAVHIRCTEEEYSASLEAARSGAELQLYVAVQCECSTYWARRALFPTEPHQPWVSSSPSVRVAGLKCSSENHMFDEPMRTFTCA